MSKTPHFPSNIHDTVACVFLRLKPSKMASTSYEVENDVLKVRPIGNTATNNKDLTERHFKFTEIFHDHTKQSAIYNQSVHSSVQSAENLTILTYGTSGSGKTYTMFGTENDAGVVQRAIAHIFTVDEKVNCKVPAAKIDKGIVSILSKHNARLELKLTATFIRKDNSKKNTKLIQRIRDEHEFKPINSDWEHLLVWISFAEIYNENVHDLLKLGATSTTRKKLTIISNDGNTYVKDLISVHVTSATDAFDVINAGLGQMNYASTRINSNSNRSHCILIVNVIHYSYPSRYAVATYKFCDLAGSERLSNSGDVGYRLKEAQQINKSLMLLHRCYDSMFHNQHSKSKQVVPFRDSKLTTLLQKSLLGQVKITKIVTMEPTIKFIGENLQVLEFAAIAQQIIHKQPKAERDRRSERIKRLSSFKGENVYDSVNEQKKNEIDGLLSEIAELRGTIEQMTLNFANERETLVSITPSISIFNSQKTIKTI